MARIECPRAPGSPPDARGSGSRVLPRSGLAGAGSAPGPAVLSLRAVLSALGFSLPFHPAPLRPSVLRGPLRSRGGTGADTLLAARRVSDFSFLPVFSPLAFSLCVSAGLVVLTAAARGSAVVVCGVGTAGGAHRSRRVGGGD